MANRVEQSFVPRSVSASGLIVTGPGMINSIVVSSGTALTIKLWDSLTASGTVILETTVAVTPTAPFTLDIKAAHATGLFLTIGGTGAVTLMVA